MQKATIRVAYKFVDGAHFFVSEDKKWAGLCSASADLKAAWSDVAVQLRNLAKYHYGQDVNFQPSESFEDFQNQLMRTLEKDFMTNGAHSAADVPFMRVMLGWVLAPLRHNREQDEVQPVEGPKRSVLWELAH
jgi:hypothetical protein